MKMLKRIVFAILLLLAAAVLFRGPLYRFVVTYRSIGQRADYAATNGVLLWHMYDHAAQKDSPDVREIIKSSLATTSKLLTFSFSGSDNDPNLLIETLHANCIGYAAMFSAICNYRLKRHGLDDRWVATHEIGQLYLFGLNVHRWFSSPFFKDHDFVIVGNRATGESYAVDPSLNDYLRIDFVKAEKRNKTAKYLDEMWYNDETEYPYLPRDTIEMGFKSYNGTNCYFHRDNSFDVGIWRYGASSGYQGPLVWGTYLYHPETREIELDFSEYIEFRKSRGEYYYSVWDIMEGLRKKNPPVYSSIGVADAPPDPLGLSRSWMKIVERSERKVRVEMYAYKEDGERISFGEQTFYREEMRRYLNGNDRAKQSKTEQNHETTAVNPADSGVAAPGAGEEGHPALRILRRRELLHT